MTHRPPLAGVVGWPIGHSRSPKLHGHWLAREGIAGYYVPIGLAPEALDEGLDADRLWWSWGLGLLRLLYRSRELPLPTSVVTAMAQHIRAQIGALL